MSKFSFYRVIFFTGILFFIESGFCPSIGSINYPKIQDETRLRKNTVIFFDVQNPSETNNPKGKYFPGLRGENQLIIYTREFNQKSTGTNEYGLEATVVDGIISKISSSNSVIPENGFIISGHGASKKWMKNNLRIGGEIDINSISKKLKVIISPLSYMYEAKLNIQETKQQLTEQKDLLSLTTIEAIKHQIQQSKLYLCQAGKAFKENNDTAFLRFLNQSLEASAKGFYLSFPGKHGEFRGIWHRPVETTKEQIINTITQIKETGFNAIFLETFYNGTTIYPSKIMRKYKFLPQKEDFNHFDPLAIWVEESHRQGLQLHTWVQNFYVGNDFLAKNKNPILTVKPQWTNVQRRNSKRKDPIASTIEPGYYFLDPSHPEVQEFLVKLYKEIAQQYRVDGLNLDYIRYPASYPKNFDDYLNSTWGYTDNALKKFRSRYKKDPLDLTLSDPLWQEWEFWRRSQITELVKRIHKVVKKENHKIILSADIFYDRDESFTLKLQDWQTWAKQNYLDALVPLCISQSPDKLYSIQKDIQNIIGKNTPIYTGIFTPYNEDSHFDLLKQIQASRKAGKEGIVLFNFSKLSELYRQSLMLGSFKRVDNGLPDLQ